MSRNINIISIQASASVFGAPFPVSGSVGLSASQGDGFNKFALSGLITATVISSGACKFAGLTALNQNASAVFLQFFDVAQGTSVTLGTTTPDFIIPIPTPSNNAAVALNGMMTALEIAAAGVTCTNGLKVAATYTPTGSAVVGLGVIGSIFYK